MEHHFDAVRVDACINEGGGFKIPMGNDFVIQVGEKGVMWTKLVVKGQGGHGSMPPPFQDFAIYKIMNVLHKLESFKKPLYVSPEYKATIDALSLPGVFKGLLKRKHALRGLLRLARIATGLDLGQVILPMVTDTIAPTVLASGIKENAISPEAHVVLDIRSLPGHDRDAINAMIRAATGNRLWNDLQVTAIKSQLATTSPIEDRFYPVIRETMEAIYPGANLVPIVSQGSTDSKFLRARGITCYGFCPTIKDDDLTYPELLGLAHNENERVSVTNLMLAVDFTYRLFHHA